MKSAYVDSFARENLPPRAQWPELRFDLTELKYPERMNCAAVLLDEAVKKGQGGRTDGNAIAVARAHRLIQQEGGAIHALRIVQLGQVELEFRPLLLRRQVVVRKGIDVGGPAHLSNSRAMITFCTSVAPS